MLKILTIAVCLTTTSMAAEVVLTVNNVGNNVLQEYIAEPRSITAVTTDGNATRSQATKNSVAFDLNEFNVAPAKDENGGESEQEQLTDTTIISAALSESLTQASPPPVLAALLDASIIEWQGQNNRLHSREELQNLYAQMHYQLLWTDNGRITPLAAQVIAATKQAKYHALNENTYHSQATSSLKAGQLVAEKEKFDVVLSDAFITLKKHLSNGIVNPKKQFSTWNTEPQFIDFVGTIKNIRAANDIGKTFVVDDADYRVLQTAYKTILDRADSHTSTKIISTTALRPGTTGEDVRLLRQRLGLDDDSDLYDKDLRQAVRNYQSDNGLSADGIAGPKTLAMLNGDNDEHRLQQLAINMERYRWGNRPKNQNYIWVNIPAFGMAIKNNDETVFYSKVIVGKASRQTPVFSDTMENIVLAPYWNVPKTIYKKDKLPRLKKNPNALGSSMQVISTATGKVVDPASVDWEGGGKGYRLRQKPGSGNALGRMKFLFPNHHAIYLHDTPNRRLFKRSRRAFSSGCIRVERAEDLAVFFLQDIGYDRARIKKESRRSRERWVGLPDAKRYPVFLNYFTAWADADGRVKYGSDIYKYDASMKQLYQEALQASN